MEKNESFYVFRVKSETDLDEFLIFKLDKKLLPYYIQMMKTTISGLGNLMVEEK